MADGRRPASRPRRRPRSGPGKARPRQRPASVPRPGNRRPAGRSTLTTRAAILGVVVSALALLLAIPLKTYLSQRSQIADLAQAQAAQQQTIAGLRATVSQGADPAYVAQQARQRLHLVAPGEQDYVVVPGAKKPAPPAVTAAPAVVVPGSDENPWWTRLWASTTQADTR